MNANQFLAPLAFALLGVSVSGANADSLFCNTSGVSEALALKCVLSEVDGSIVPAQQARAIDALLKRHGYESGLGYNAEAPQHQGGTSISPVLYYSDNINGGNSPDDLVIGNLIFTGDEGLHLKEGVVAGLGLELSGRSILGEGRTLSYAVNTAYAHSPKYGIGIMSAGAQFCSINHVRSWWYLDACVNTSRVRKELTDETNSNISLTGSKPFKSGKHAYSQAKLGINRYFAEHYEQNQITLGFDTIHTNGMTSAAKVILGASVENQLATRLAISGQVTRPIAQRPLTLSASFADADGGLLLGVERSDQTYSISVSYPVWNNLAVNVGFRETNSTIAYFDTDTPTFGLQFASIQF